MEVTSDGIGIMVVVLGGLFVVSGIALMVILVREKTWWENLIMGMLAMPLDDLVPGSLGAMVPMVQQMLQSLLKKIFNYVRICALVGGAGVSCLGAVLVVIGIYIWS